jgi:nitrite reductase (NADH) large subunit
VVNERLETSDPSIYACGECIEYRNETWGLVAPVYDQSRVLAFILTGTDTLYVPSPPASTRLKSDIPVISMGKFKPEAGDELTMYVDPNTLVFKQLIIKDSLVLGAVLVGEELNADLISLHYSAKIPAPSRRADLLFPGARAGEGIIDGKLIPDNAKICDCNGVSAAKIRQSIAHGNDTLYKVMNNTKAGTGCGNCKGKIKALLISEIGELRTDPAEKFYAAGIPMEREILSEFIKNHNIRSCSEVFAAIPGVTDDSRTRMALDYLLNYIWKNDYIIENDSRCANDRYSGNIQNDGRFSVIPNIAGGIATSQHLRAIADAADKYNAMIKITGADRIGLYSIDKADLKNV